MKNGEPDRIRQFNPPVRKCFDMVVHPRPQHLVAKMIQQRVHIVRVVYDIRQQRLLPVDVCGKAVRRRYLQLRRHPGQLFSGTQDVINGLGDTRRKVRCSQACANCPG